LIEIIIPASIEFLGEKCFSDCKSLSSITFESGSKFQGIEREVLSRTGWIGRNGMFDAQVEEVRKV
jgi:hypothetical protein